MDWGIRDSVVVITGAANGIGRATADVFAAEGAMVVLADVDAALAQKSAHEIESTATLSIKALYTCRLSFTGQPRKHVYPLAWIRPAA